MCFRLTPCHTSLLPQTVNTRTVVKHYRKQRLMSGVFFFYSRVLVARDQTHLNNLTGGAAICRQVRRPNATHQQYHSVYLHTPTAAPEPPLRASTLHPSVPQTRKDRSITVLIIYLILIRSSDEYSLIYSFLYENSPLNLTELCFIQIRQSP